MTKIITALAAAAVICSCTNTAPKVLVLYYSQTGATAQVAEEIAKQTGADIERIDVVEIYNGDFDATIQRCLGERESGFTPTLVPIKSDLTQYDIIFIGYPVWFGTYAPPVKALIDSINQASINQDAEKNTIGQVGINTEGKKIVPFCTFGSGGLESSSADLASALPTWAIAPGFGIRNARLQHASEELNRFLIENGYKEGEIEPLAEYSEQGIVTPEEALKYWEAVDGYPFPMGEPVTAACRPAEKGGTDYIFVVTSTDRNGNQVEGKVYVTALEGQKAEFTRAVR